MHRARLRLLRVVLGAACLLTWAGCAREEPTPLRIGTVLWTGHEPLFLARQLGYLDERQVRLVEYSSLSEVVRAYRNGAVEGVGVTLDMVLVLRQHGFDPRVVLVLDFSLGGDVVVARPDIRDLASLRGRRVGVEDFGVSVYLLSRALGQVGLKLSDVQVFHVPADQQARAFQEGEVDAVVAFEPYAQALLEAGARKLFDSTRIPGEVVDVLAVRGDVLGSHEDAIQHLGQAWFGALAWMEAHPEEAISRMRQRPGMSEEDFSRTLQGLRLPELEENRALLTGPAPGLLGVSERLQQRLLELGILELRLELEELTSARALPGEAP